MTPENIREKQYIEHFISRRSKKCWNEIISDSSTEKITNKKQILRISVVTCKNKVKSTINTKKKNIPGKLLPFLIQGSKIVSPKSLWLRQLVHTSFLAFLEDEFEEFMRILEITEMLTKRFVMLIPDGRCNVIYLRWRCKQAVINIQARCWPSTVNNIHFSLG